MFSVILLFILPSPLSHSTAIFNTSEAKQERLCRRLLSNGSCQCNEWLPRRRRGRGWQRYGKQQVDEEKCQESSQASVELKDTPQSNFINSTNLWLLLWNGVNGPKRLSVQWSLACVGHVCVWLAVFLCCSESVIAKRNIFH